MCSRVVKNLIERVCNCEEGLYGYDCSFSIEDKRMPCKDDCNGRGDCISGKCYCNPGYFGDTCKNQTYFMCPGSLSQLSNIIIKFLLIKIFVLIYQQFIKNRRWIL